MSRYTAFLKKELLESVRTYKLFIMLTVFFLFGVMSPLTAKFMPEIIASFAPEGMTVTIADPTAIDAWAQFFKNISQMGLIIMVILYNGILATELSKGTLVNMLTKGLSRSTVIFAKLTSMTMVWTISYVTAFLITWGYAVYLFPGDEMSNLLFSVFCLWLFGVFLLSLLLFSAALVKSNYGGLLITALVIAALIVLNAVPKLQKFNPLALVGHNVALLTNSTELTALQTPMVIAVLVGIGCITASMLIFNKRQI